MTMVTLVRSTVKKKAKSKPPKSSPVKPIQVVVGPGHFGRALLSALIREGKGHYALGVYYRLSNTSTSQQWLNKLKKDAQIVLNSAYPNTAYLLKASVLHLCIKPSDLNSFCQLHPELNVYQGIVVSWLGSTTYQELTTYFPKAKVIRGMSSILLQDNTVMTAYLGSSAHLSLWSKNLSSKQRKNSLFYKVGEEDTFLFHVPVVGSLSALFAHQLMMLASELGAKTQVWEELNKGAKQQNAERSSQIEKMLLRLFRKSLSQLKHYKDFRELIGEVATSGGLTEKMIQYHGHQHQRQKIDKDEEYSIPWPLVTLKVLKS